jgi:hypothetical protein
MSFASLTDHAPEEASARSGTGRLDAAQAEAIDEAARPTAIPITRSARRAPKGCAVIVQRSLSTADAKLTSCRPKALHDPK